jgi:hypothetical protein
MVCRTVDKAVTYKHCLNNGPFETEACPTCKDSVPIIRTTQHLFNAETSWLMLSSKIITVCAGNYTRLVNILHRQNAEL